MRAALEPGEGADPWRIPAKATRTYGLALPRTDRYAAFLAEGAMDVAIALYGGEGEEVALSERRPFLEASLEDPLRATFSIPEPIGEGPDRGPVAWYPFQGNTRDVSPYRNHGDAAGAKLTVDRTGKSNAAYAFDGEADQIVVPDDDSLDVTEAISLCAWVMPVERRTQVIVRKGAGVNGPTAAPYELALSGTGDVVFSLRIEGELEQVRVNDYPTNSWFHVAGTWDGEKAVLYVGGVPESSKPLEGELPTNDSPLLIGSRLRKPADTFFGRIDDVRIYNRALDRDELKEILED